MPEITETPSQDRQLISEIQPTSPTRSAHFETGHPRIANQPLVDSIITPDGSGVPQEVSVTFPWANDLTDMQYTLESSTDHQNGTPLTTTVADTVVEDLVSRITINASLASIVAERTFIRLNVTQP